MENPFKTKKIAYANAALVSAALLFAASFAWAGWSASSRLKITEALMTSRMNGARRPAQAASEFAAGTTAVYCWFSWKNAKPGLQMTTRWHYTSSLIPILDSSLTLNRVADNGVISLRMPAGKTFPTGSYRLDFEVKGEVVKSVSFAVSSQT